MNRQLVAPHRFDEDRGADDPVGIEDQASQERALAAGAEDDDLALIADDIDPPEDPEQHTRA
jgi:hypothetical protein